jgi:hypothetical protein
MQAADHLISNGVGAACHKLAGFSTFVIVFWGYTVVGNRFFMALLD